MSLGARSRSRTGRAYNPGAASTRCARAQRAPSARLEPVNECGDDRHRRRGASRIGSLVVDHYDSRSLVDRLSDLFAVEPEGQPGSSTRLASIRIKDMSGRPVAHCRQRSPVRMSAETIGCCRRHELQGNVRAILCCHEHCHAANTVTKMSLWREPVSPPRYRMTIDLNVLDHLGINLYSNVAAVLTEAVANSWDADAANVHIDFDMARRTITIRDDGIGMSVEDTNNRYLRVAYRRRENEPTTTAKSRKVMGRKGLGKLSLFSIADTVEVRSCKDGVPHGLRMSAAAIRKRMEEQNAEYYPEEISVDTTATETGTRIVLSDLKKGRLAVTGAAVRRRLARRFSVIGSDGFRVFVDGEEVTAGERGDLECVQFLWKIGDAQVAEKYCPGLLEQDFLSGAIDRRPATWSIRGWIGTSRTPKQLETPDGNLNSIVVLARGRLLQENILDRINDGRIYTKYLTGQIEADFLDLDELEDIATSDRQRVMEHDERYDELLKVLRRTLSQIEPQWIDWRRKHAVAEVVRDHPVLSKWLTALPEGYRDHAKTVLAKVGAIPIDDSADRRALLRHAVLAFERLRLKGSADQLAAAIDVGSDALLRLLADQEMLEASLYRDIVASRLDAIRAFRNLVNDDEKEKVLQKHLFRDLWLLDPSWERAAGSEQIETRLRSEGVIVDDLTQKEDLGRVDIAYRTTAGKHVIVELKRAGRRMKLVELQTQGQKYVDKLTKILTATGVSAANIEVVFVIGPVLEEEQSNPDRLKSMLASVSPGSRIVHYDALIESALASYEEYLSASEQVGDIERLVDEL